MPEDHHKLRKIVTSRMNKLLSDFGLEMTVCGGKYANLRQQIDETTGFWADQSTHAKPPRLIIHLESIGEGWSATLPLAQAGAAFAYSNTARRNVGALVVRVLPVIKVSPLVYYPHPEWEWLLWFAFYPKLRHGSSGQTFEALTPTEGTFRYLGENQPYIASGIVTLNEANVPITYPDRIAVGERTAGIPSLTYGQATQAIAEYVRSSATFPEPSEPSDEE